MAEPMLEPLDRIRDASRALGGIGELLMFAWKSEGRDMHGVDPENLFYTIDIIRQHIDDACDEQERQRLSA